MYLFRARPTTALKSHNNCVSNTVYIFLYSKNNADFMLSMPLLIILVPFETVKIMDRNLQICNKFEI